jgi:hypothetical protein
MKERIDTVEEDFRRERTPLFTSQFATYYINPKEHMDQDILCPTLKPIGRSLSQYTILRLPQILEGYNGPQKLDH